MFTREEVLLLWDDLLSEENNFLLKNTEVILRRQIVPKQTNKVFGYFVSIVIKLYSKDLFVVYNRLCEKHGCTYRIDPSAPELVFYKERVYQTPPASFKENNS